MSKLTRFISEIHRRSLWQVLGIYLVAAWLAYEVILGLTEGGVLPGWFPGAAVGLFVLGVPFVLATAFVQEGMPGASRRRSSGEQSVQGAEEVKSPAAHAWFNWRNALLGLLAVVVVGGMLAAASMVVQPGEALRGDRDPPSIAVLPFANLSADEEDEYFTDGIHDEILTQLFKISGLEVTSRTSVMTYKDRPANLRTVAEDLGVRYILEGTVRRFGDEVKITSQLIDAVRDVHIWSESYTRDRRDLLEIQAEVAKQIARTLQTELSPAELARIDAQPTDDPDAYDAYLRALDYNRSGEVAGRDQRESDWRIAAELYSRAIDRDPEFALAWADLGYIHLRLYWYGYDRTPERAQRAEQAVTTAGHLDPDLPQYFVCRGYYEYWVERDYDAAVREFRRGLEGLPGDHDTRSLIGFVERRRGNLEAAAAEIEKAVEQDPLNGNLAEELGNTLRGMRRWEEAARYLNRAMELAPDYPDGYLRKIDLLVSWTGSTEGARRVLTDAEAVAPARDLLPTAVWIETLDRRWDDALARIDAYPGDVIDAQYDVFPLTLLRAGVLDLAGRMDEARAAYREAARVLDALARDTIDYRPVRARARALAGLGRHEEAIAAAERALELMPMDVDAWAAPDLVEDLAYVLMRAGRESEAVDRLEFLVDTPSRNRTTPALLAIDPRWDPLRDHPGFQALVARAEA